MNLKQQSLALAIATVLGLSASPIALAQTADQAMEEEGLMEEVVVTGVRRSLMDSTAIKRDADQIMDAISAEEIGKLPDLNVAEAMQRITGVQIGRNDAGEGSSFQVRGLSQNNVTINGRSVMGSTSNNRTNSFDAVASSQFKAIKVVKTPTADMIEGSLGATVKLETFKPMDFKKQTIQYNAQAVDNELNDDTGWFVQGLYGNNWEAGSGRWGIVVNASYEEKYVTTHRMNYNWQGVNNYNILADSGVPNDHTVFRAQQISAIDRPFDFETAGIDATITWEPNDQWSLSASYNWNDQERQRAQNIWHTFATAGWQDLQPGAVYETYTRAPTGREFMEDANGDLIPVTGDLSRTLILAGLWDHNSSRTAANNETISTDQEVYGFNVEWTPGDWAIRFDAGFSETTYDRYNINTATTLTGDYPNGERMGWAFDFTTNDDIPHRLEVFYPEFGHDPAGALSYYNYQWNNFSARFDQNYLSEDAYKLDFTRNVDFFGFKMIDFGARFAERQVDRYSQRMFNSGGANLDGIRNLGEIEDYSPGFVTGFWGESDPIFKGFSGVFPATWIAPTTANYNVWEEYMAIVTPDASIRDDITYPFDITEETTAFYIAGSFNFDWGSVPVSGNVGIRYVETDVESIGRVDYESALEGGETLEALGLTCDLDTIYERQDNGDQAVNCTARPSYDNTLPSFNINFGLRENLYLRIGAARVMARPNPEDLTPSVSIPQGQGSSGTSGNPNLDPFEADQFDISMEWYIDQINTLSAAYFYKDVKNFITRTRTTYPSSVDNNQDGVIDELDDVSIIRPVNGGTAEISGIELAWQGTLDNVSDSWWGGFGALLNYTYVDSEQDQQINELTGQQLPYPNLSETSYNAILFYEKYNFSIRLAYNWRDDNYQSEGGRRSDREGYYSYNEFGDAERYQASLSTFNEEYGQLDLSMSYTFNPMFTIYAQATNLTDDVVYQYGSVPIAVTSATHTGTTWRVGLRGRF